MDRRGSEPLAIDNDGYRVCAVERAVARVHRQGQGGDSAGVDRDRGRARDLGIDTGPLPMLGKSVHDDPMHPIVAQRPRREADLPRQRLTAAGDDAVHATVDLSFGCRGVEVLGIDTDDVLQRHAFGGKRLLHHVGGLLLRVVVAAIGDRGAVDEVDGPIVAIVEVPELFFPPGRFQLFLLINSQELRRLREARARRRRRPAPGMMHGEMPARGPAHRESAHGDAVAVDGVVLLDVVHSFKCVHLAGKVVRVGIAAIGVQHESVRRCEVAKRLLPAVDEGQLAQRLAAAVKPDVEPMLKGGAWPIRRGDDQAIGLDRAVDLRDIAADDKACCRGPGGDTLTKLLDAVLALVEQLACDGDLVFLKELAVFQCVMDGVAVDLDIGQEFKQSGLSCQRGAQSVDVAFEADDTGGQADTVELREFDAGRRDRSHLFGDVIRGAIGQDHAGSEEQG